MKRQLISKDTFMSNINKPNETEPLNGDYNDKYKGHEKTPLNGYQSEQNNKTKRDKTAPLSPLAVEPKAEPVSKPSSRFGMLRFEFLETRQTLKFDIYQLMTLGRPDPVTGRRPTVDFTPLAGYRMGVSRHHAEIRWKSNNVLEVMDLGSGNGTFLNDTRCTANRPYEIYNGDQLRLGQLGMYVYYEIYINNKPIIPIRGL